MANTPPAKEAHASPPSGRVVLAAFVAAQVVYVLMLNVTLPQLEAMAGGLRPFDMLPGGYDLTAAQQLLGALGTEGRTLYLTRQIPLDMIYPGLFALAYGLSWRWLAPRTWPSLMLFSWLPVAVGLADYTENALIIRMLSVYPELSTGLVTTASTATVVKSVLTTTVLLALVVMLARLAQKRFSAS